MSDPIRYYGNSGTNVGGINVETPYEDKKEGVKVEDFLQLMIAQLSNQDFMNPVDDTQYVTQLAQFATMQSMQELSYYSQTNYVSSLLGKNVTVASLGLGGQVNKVTGPVTKINLSGEEYTLTVDGKDYKLNQIMSMNNGEVPVSESELSAANEIVLRVLGTEANAISLAWDPPVTDEDKLKGLTYDVYYTTNASLDFTELSGVKRGTLAASDLKKPEYVIDKLEPGKTYFINVVVKNKEGDEAVYQRTVQSTKA